MTGLPLMEHFYTIQGEGYHSGRPAYFIRLGGCDVGCTWCDVKESWDASKHATVGAQDIARMVIESGTDFAVITGGEPCTYDLSELTAELRRGGMKTALETSGSHSVHGHFDWICLSPKKFRPALTENFALADELKVIVFNHDDLKWCEEMAACVRPHCHLYLQPEWDSREKMLPFIVEYVKQNTQWHISLQTHKYINIP